MDGRTCLSAGVVAAAFALGGLVPPRAATQREARCPEDALVELRDRATRPSLPRLVCPDEADSLRTSRRYEAGPPSGPRELLLGRPMDVDRAGAADLEALPGVGPALAAAIVADREARGPFGSARALDRVRGVGPGRLRALEGLVAGGAEAVPRGRAVAKPALPR